MSKINQLILSVCDDTKRFGINLYRTKYESDYLCKWTKTQEARLLVLDGSLGGRSGNDYKDLSTDLTAQDDWKIGKKYDAQSYVRTNVVLYRDAKGNIKIRFAKEDELQNAYLVVSKRMIREKSKNLMRAKANEIEKISRNIILKYIFDFNHISNGEIYSFEFLKDDQSYLLEDIYDFMDEKVLCNIPFIDAEFNILFEKVREREGDITQLSIKCNVNG